MATLKAVVLLNNRRTDGTYNVKIRLTHKRVSRYISTPYYVTKEQLTRSGRIKDTYILDKVNEEIMRMRRKIDDFGFLANDVGADSMVRVAVSDTTREMDFFSYSCDYISKLRNDGREGTAMIRHTAVSHLRSFVGKDTLLFSEMTSDLMLRFNGHLYDDVKLRQGTVNNVMSSLRTIYNDAKRTLNDEENGIFVIRWDCFSKIEKRRTESASGSIRAFGSVDEMQRIIDLPIGFHSSMKVNSARDMFIFSFVTMGMNAADIVRLRKTDYRDGVITYRRKKVERVSGQSSEIQVRCGDVAKAIIERHMGRGNLLLDFGVTVGMDNVMYHLKRVFEAAGLSGKGYVFYTARHSMASFSINVCGTDRYVVHEMLNHASDSRMKITDTYVKKDYSHLWEANDRLLSLFDWSRYISG